MERACRLCFSGKPATKVHRERRERYVASITSVLGDDRIRKDKTGSSHDVLDDRDVTCDVVS